MCMFRHRDVCNYQETQVRGGWGCLLGTLTPLVSTPGHTAQWLMGKRPDVAAFCRSQYYLLPSLYVI